MAADGIIEVQASAGTMMTFPREWIIRSVLDAPPYGQKKAITCPGPECHLPRSLPASVRSVSWVFS